MPNTLDTMLDDAITRGLQQGLEQGMQQGEAEGRRAALRTILRARFRSIPADLEQRIATADTAALDALLTRAAVVEKIGDL